MEPGCPGAGRGAVRRRARGSQSAAGDRSHVRDPGLPAGQAAGMGHLGGPDPQQTRPGLAQSVAPGTARPRGRCAISRRGWASSSTSNHADEVDMRACLELSRRCGRRFLYMMNSEAFDEGFGSAGWWLQRLGAFSVERGGPNEQAKRYAIDAVKQGREVLVIFPEGEIYYLNDLVQPFKSGGVEIGMQAVVEARRTRPDWTAYLVPMAIKYRYRRPIGPLLERRTRADGAASLPAHPRRLAPATIGPHHGGTPASPGGSPSSEARPGSSRRDERAGAGSAAAGPLRRWRDTTRARPPTPGPRRWIGRGGSAPICGAC